MYTPPVALPLLEIKFPSWYRLAIYSPLKRFIYNHLSIGIVSVILFYRNQYKQFYDIHGRFTIAEKGPAYRWGLFFFGRLSDLAQQPPFLTFTPYCIASCNRSLRSISAFPTQ